MRMRRAFGLLVLALGCAAPAWASSAAQDWVLYRNERFGFSFVYPAKVFAPDRVSAGGDGQLFVAGNARLLAGAFENSSRYAPARYQELVARQSYAGANISYARRGRSWFVLSGEREGNIFYEKVMFSCGGGIINSFALIYPREQRDLFDPIVERIEDSFRPDEGKCG